MDEGGGQSGIRELGGEIEVGGSGIKSGIYDVTTHESSLIGLQVPRASHVVKLRPD